MLVRDAEGLSLRRIRVGGEEGWKEAKIDRGDDRKREIDILNRWATAASSGQPNE